MEEHVKDFMVPIAKFPRISDTATFSGAVMALERAQEELCPASVSSASCWLPTMKTKLLENSPQSTLSVAAVKFSSRLDLE